MRPTQCIGVEGDILRILNLRPRDSLRGRLRDLGGRWNEECGSKYAGSTNHRELLPLGLIGFDGNCLGDCLDPVSHDHSGRVGVTLSIIKLASVVRALKESDVCRPSANELISRRFRLSFELERHKRFDLLISECIA